MLRLTKDFYCSGLSLHSKNASGEVYVSSDGCHAIGFVGKRGKPAFNYSFKTAERMTSFAKDWLDRAEATEQNRREQKRRRKEEQRTAAEQLAGALSPGAIVYSSWGYEQTNVDFYQVLRRSGRVVVLRRIAGEMKESTGAMSGYVSAIKDAFSDSHPEEIRTVIRSGELSIGDYSARLWAGDPKFCSWYG
jgi:hypothetical protein